MRPIRVIGDPQLKLSRAAFNPGSNALNYIFIISPLPMSMASSAGSPANGTAADTRDCIAAGRKKGLILLEHDMSEEAGMERCALWLKGSITEVLVEFLPAG